MTAQPVHPSPAAPLALDEILPYTTPGGRFSVTLQRVRPEVFAVTVYQGTLRLNDLCGSYDTEVVGRAVARGLAYLFKMEDPIDA